MNKTEFFNLLDLMPLSDNERLVNLDDKFILIDNLDVEGYAKEQIYDACKEYFVGSPHPFKLTYIQFCLCLGGSLHVRLNMEDCLIGKNDLLIGWPGSVGELVDISSDFRSILIGFSDMAYVPEVNIKSSMIMRKHMTFNHIIHVSDDDANELVTIYRLMKKKIKQPEFEYKNEVIKSYMQIVGLDLCNLMSSYIEKHESMVDSRKKQLFYKFMDLVHQYYCSERSVIFYADKMCLSPKYLSQTIFQYSGRHASEWIRDFVILEAKVLLRTKEYTVQQVSDKLNFPNQSFFGVYFKKSVGCSPKAYLEME